MCYAFFRPLLFQLPPETAHNLAVRALQMPFWLRSHQPPASLNTSLAGLAFKSPIGLAAGFDKDAKLCHAMQKAGFGFMEVGSITPKPQAGNPKPRLFRLSENEAVINRMGFNNDGLDAASARLQTRPEGGFVIGGNIGKNKTSEDAVADYVTGLNALYPLTDYITVNISSPNTPGLRDLQGEEHFISLVSALHETRAARIAKGEHYKPIFVKIAPDLEEKGIASIATAARALKLDGLVVGNTTLSREAVAASPYAHEAGGLSGKPLMQPSTRILRQFYAQLQGEVPLIAAGGVASAEDAYAKILAGAALVQLYSALVYQGFSLIPRIHKGLEALLKRDGYAHVADAIGQGALE